MTEKKQMHQRLSFRSISQNEYGNSVTEDFVKKKFRSVGTLQTIDFNQSKSSLFERNSVKDQNVVAENTSLVKRVLNYKSVYARDFLEENFEYHKKIKKMLTKLPLPDISVYLGKKIPKKTLLLNGRMLPRSDWIS